MSAPVRRSSKDVGWEFGMLRDSNNFDKVQCNFCQKLFSGGVYRLKQHVSGMGTNVRACPDATPEARQKYRDAILANQASKRKKAEIVSDERQEVRLAMRVWFGYAELKADGHAYSFIDYQLLRVREDMERFRRDMLLTDNSVPLSPQWLLPKSWDNKAVVIDGEPHSYSGHGNLGMLKLVNEEDAADTTKNKDVFRYAVPGVEFSHHESWRDEERDVNISVKRDHRRDGEKEFGSPYKEDRLVENSASRKFGEGRRSVPDGRFDLGYKECNFDKKREMKWSTGWGPGIKETEGFHDKRAELSRDSDIYLDKGSPVVANVKNDRPWKPSFSQGRGKIDHVHQNHTPNKPTSYFSYGRGRGDSSSSATPSLGRGRTGSTGGFIGSTSHPHPFIYESDKSNGDTLLLKYGRTKMLDLYRKFDIRLQRKMFDGFESVPSLTLEESLEPLALCAPTPEELAVLMGIDKGDITCGAAPRTSKEGPVRNSTDFVYSRKDGPGESAIYQDTEKVLICRNRGSRGVTFFNDESNSHSLSARDKSHMDESDWSRGSFTNASEISPTPNGLNRESEYGLLGSHEQSDLTNDNTKTRRQPLTSERDRERVQVGSHPLTEDLMFYYKDPQGDVQGPFSAREIVHWFEAEFFGINLQVRLANESHDSPFYSLGDVMPHLRSKTKTPPGFGLTKAAEHTCPLSQPRLNDYEKAHSHSSESSFVQDDDHQHKVLSSTEVENRFIESLMSYKTLPPIDMPPSSQGFQRYSGNTASILPNLGAENVNGLHLLEQKLAFERQMSSSSMFIHCPSRESTSADQHLKMVSDFNGQHDAKLQYDHFHTPDLMSILQGIAARSSPSINSGVSNWPGLSSFGSVDPYQNKLSNFHPGHNVPSMATEHGISSPMDHTRSNPLAQAIDSLNPETLSNLLHNPEVLDLLQKCYLTQLHCQTPSLPPSQEILVLEKLLLLKQQQKQEEIVRQQEQLLSHVLSDNQSQQSYGHHGASVMPSSAVSVDCTQSKPPYSNEVFLQPQISNMPNKPSSNYHHVTPHQVSEIYSPPSLHLPHQMCPNIKDFQHTNKLDVSVPTGANKSQLVDSNPKNEFFDPEGVTPQPESNVAISEIKEHSPVAVSHIVEGSHNVSKPEKANCKNVPPLISFGEINPEAIKGDSGCVIIKDTEFIETNDTKKSSSKKSRKAKSLKANDGSGQRKCIVGSSSELLKSSDMESKGSSSTRKNLCLFDRSVSVVQEADLFKSVGSNAQKYNSQAVNFRSMKNEADTIDASAVRGQNWPQSVQDKKESYGQRAWKPSVDVRPKSLLQIQQEEQRKTEAVAINDIAEAPKSKEIDHREEVGCLNLKMSEQSVNDKPRNDDDIPDNSIFSMDAYIDSVVEFDTNDNDFIDAKEIKKGKKKLGKSKGNGVNNFTSTASTGAYYSDKGKGFCQIAQQQEALSVSLPACPSLGDFVFWKESVNLNSPPAWVMGSAKAKKQTSLREIQKEQENNTSSFQNSTQMLSQKVEPVTDLRGSVYSLSSPMSFPKAPLHVPKSTRSMGDDDLFWGPTEQQQSNHEPTKAGFPELSPKGMAVKGVVQNQSSSSSLHRSSGVVKPAERSLSSSPVTAQFLSAKAKKGVANKHAEAADFRRWCQSESARLTGSSDTGFLEFCAKQGRSEAEILLVENIGARDPNHDFIDRFLNFTELLPSDVIKLAFQGNLDGESSSGVVEGGNNVRVREGEQERSTKGKRKGGKKGKKVNPATLGFSVVSNRIMMGEIQTLEE